MHRLRFALRPGWLVLHVITVALVITMGVLGHWQLDVSETKHFNIRNFGYALQWWAFCVFTLAMWWKIMRDRVQQDETMPEVAATTAPTVPDEPVAYRRYVAPAPAPIEDDTLAAYNDYLAGLHSSDGGTA